MTDTIGSQDEAARIYHYHQAFMDAVSDPTGLTPMPYLPNGWTYLGCGCWRDVYLSPTGFVYKLPSTTDDIPNEANLCEWVCVQRANTNKHWQAYVPKTAAYWISFEPVICMEYIPGEPGDVSEEDLRTINELEKAVVGVIDSGPLKSSRRSPSWMGNLRRRADGQVVLIDLGGAGDLAYLPSFGQRAA